MRNHLISSVTKDELYVAEVLLNLRETIPLIGSKSAWSYKKRRSGLDVGPSDTRAPSSSPSQVKPEDGGAAATTTASPNSPLYVLFTESDEKNMNSFQRISKNRSREKYMKTIEKLTQTGDVLRREIENVRKYYNELKACNSKLKSKKEEVVKTCSRKEHLQMEISPRENRLELTQLHGITMVSHQQPLISDRTAQKYLYPFAPITTQLHSSSNELGSDNIVGRVIDLNIPVEMACGNRVDPFQTLDMNGIFGSSDKRARFAEARRLRKGMIKIKSMRRACGIRFPFVN